MEVVSLLSLAVALSSAILLMQSWLVLRLPPNRPLDDARRESLERFDPMGMYWVAKHRRAFWWAIVGSLCVFVPAEVVRQVIG